MRLSHVKSFATGTISCKTRFLGRFARLRVFLPIDFEIGAVEEVTQTVVKIVVSGMVECKVVLVNHNFVLSNSEIVFTPNALSRLRKGVGVMGYVLHFMHRCRGCS